MKEKILKLPESHQKIDNSVLKEIQKEKKSIVNFVVSKSLHRRFKSKIAESERHKSMGAAMESWIVAYVEGRLD